MIYKGANTNHRSPIWASQTPGKGSHPHRLVMQKDGNLVIYDSQDHPTWASGTHGRGATDAFMVMQSDGNLVIYNNSPISPLWASHTNGPGGIDCQKSESWPHDWSKFEDEVLSLVNQVRAKGAFCGGRWRSPVSSIKYNWKLRYAARCHAVDMALYDYFSHVNQQGGTLGKRISEVGYQFSNVAENIAKGQTSPKQVVDGWINSSGHCHNIMTDYEEIGIAYIGENYYQGGRIWVQKFGTPM
jgi:uncharacterized protein YkwD